MNTIITRSKNNLKKYMLLINYVKNQICLNVMLMKLNIWIV